MYITKISWVVCHVLWKCKQTTVGRGLSKCSVVLLWAKSARFWAIWTEKKDAEHFDRSGLSGEKERQIFAQIDQSDLIGEKERNQGRNFGIAAAGFTGWISFLSLEQQHQSTEVLTTKRVIYVFPQKVFF